LRIQVGDIPVGPPCELYVLYGTSWLIVDIVAYCV